MNMPSKRSALLLVALVAGATAWSQTAPAGPVPLAQRIGHYIPERNNESGGHGGGGGLRHMNVVNTRFITGNLGFVQKGVLDPKSSIAEHFHLSGEEMFIILDGEAQFTVNGRTSLIKGPAAVPCRMGSAHAIYNPTDKPIVWMNVSVALNRGIGGGFNLGDDRKNVKDLDPVPQFISMRFDPKLLQPVAAMDGGKGTVMYRRGLDPIVFLTPWSWIDHMILPPGTSIGARANALISEVYFVISGSGTATIGNETVPIKADDAVPVNINEARSFAQTGTEPLEFMIIGVAKDMEAKLTMQREAGAREGGGRRGKGAPTTEAAAR